MSGRRRTWLAAVIGLIGLAILVWWGYGRYQQAPPPAITTAACAHTPETTAPTSPWRFRPDLDDIGLNQEWFAASFDDSAWDESVPGTPWETQGYDGYDGIGWYRATYRLPAHWEQAYLGTVQVDDRARIWINGREQTVTPVIALPIGEPVQISYRIEDDGGFGGIKQPVLVGESPQAVLGSGEYVRWLAANNPDWPLPGWARNSYYAWTFTGAPLAANEALISDKTAVSPWADAPIVEWWLLTTDGRLITPAPILSLLGDTLPIPQSHWQVDELAFDSTLFADFADGGVYWQLTAVNEAAQAQPVELLAVVRPLAVTADVRPIYAAGFDRSDRLWLNGSLFLAASEQPAQTSVATLADLMADLGNGRFPTTRYLDCLPDGDGTAVLRFPLSLAAGGQQTITLTFPAEPGGDLPDPAEATAVLAQTEAAWRAELGTPDIEIPDGLIMNAYKASLGYLLLALDPDGPHPGPLNHDALWVRDAAFIGETLISLGRADIVTNYLPSLWAYQDENGYVPAVIDADGPWDKEEWDAQGQLIFLIAELYRYERDLAQLEAWYPQARLAAEFLVELRQETAANPPISRGILPPSESAEDLGPGDWHHYWDDFWGIIGLENAAFLARELGETDDAVWMQAEADGLRDALRASIEAVMGPEPAYIPNGPEDTTSSAMARGSANSLYPETVFERDDPLIIRSFDEYYARWIAPQGGGYQHIFGHWWPYGGLGLARDYVRLGRHDILHQILGWTLTHQTLPGTFAWAEQVNPGTGGFSGGDMPHAWAASSYITLIREMLVMRDGDRLELLAGVPGSWLEQGKVVAVRDAPTPFGVLTAVTQSDLTIDGENWTGTLHLTVSGTANPPGGFVWRLPHLPDAVEGPPGTSLSDGWLIIPAAGGEIALTFR